MKLESGLPRYLERFFERGFAVLGALLLVAGLALFLYQAYLYVDLGIWGKLPASSLFVEPRIPVDGFQVSKDIEKPPVQRQLPASVRELIAYEKLYSIVPDWFRSKTSWLADPDYLYGLHNIVIWLLDFLSISVFLLLVGTTILALSLRESSRDAVPVRRGRTT